MDGEEILYAIRVKDVQKWAKDVLGRNLTDDELETVRNSLVWYLDEPREYSISKAMSEYMGKESIKG